MIFNNDLILEFCWKLYLNLRYLSFCIDDVYIFIFLIIIFIENYNIVLLKYVFWLVNMFDLFICGFKSFNVMKEIVSNCSM